ncbi:MAG: hypothetical protein ACLQUY_23705 [Ktedonobacterales bacterium]
MSQNPYEHTHDFDDDDELDNKDFDPDEYDVMLELERLESLEEEMVEMKVTNLDEVRERITQLHQQLDRSN